MEGIAEGGGAGWTCRRCIDDRYLTKVRRTQEYEEKEGPIQEDQ